MVQFKTIKDPTDLLVSFNFSQKTPKSKCSSCGAISELYVNGEKEHNLPKQCLLCFGDRAKFKGQSEKVLQRH